MHIGPHRIDPPLVLAPMAGVSDRPFRALCREFGAGLVVSEMIIAEPRLWASHKSRSRLDLAGEPGPVGVQIMGAEPGRMAEAARLAVERGAQTVDINMGCPARKVRNRAAGSALLEDERMATAIMRAVVAAVDVPVTLKIRLGPDRTRMNGGRIAQIAEDSGIRALAVHGRTRACGFAGKVDYEAIAAIKAIVEIPVIANGDIDSPETARRVLDLTGADALMIGRGALGRPWIFGEIAYALAIGPKTDHPRWFDTSPGQACRPEVIADIVRNHVIAIHNFYGEAAGVRIARKHIGWYLDRMAHDSGLRFRIIQATTSTDQLRLLEMSFHVQPMAA